MSSPRHLWSGDWELDSTAAREELAQRRAQTDEPVEAPPAAAPPPPRPSAAARALAWLREARDGAGRLIGRLRPSSAQTRRGWQIRVGLLLALLSAGLTFGVTTLLIDAAGSGSAVASAAHGWLGIDVIGSPLGTMVLDVAPGSPAQKAGLQPGDVLTGIATQPITTVDAVSAALNGLHAGDRIVVRYTRGFVSYTAQTKLVARPRGHP